MVIQGKRASVGTCTGTVQWITSAKHVQMLKPGNILATKMTTPDWIEAFVYIKQNGGGMITSLGGLTCHAAVVCREYKIPCVVSVPDAQSLDGKVVTIDGATGEVHVHD